MASDQFSVEEPKKSGGGCTTVIIGCLVFSLVLAAIVCGVGYYVYLNATTMVANFMESQANELIDSSDLPDGQKQEMKQQISRVAKGYRDGEVSLEQVGQIGEKLAKSPAFTAIPIEVARSKYILPSGLTEEQKAETTKELQRVAHGMFEKEITEDELKTLLDGRIADLDAEGELQFRDSVSDEELLSLSEAAKKLADEKGIPDEDFNIDLAAELKKAIDEVLKGHSDEVGDINIDMPGEEAPM